MARARRWTCTTINDDGSISYFLFHGDPSRNTAYLKLTINGNTEGEIGTQFDTVGGEFDLKPDQRAEIQAQVQKVLLENKTGSDKASGLWALLYRYWKENKK